MWEKHFSYTQSHVCRKGDKILSYKCSHCICKYLCPCNLFFMSVCVCVLQCSPFSSLFEFASVLSASRLTVCSLSLSLSLLLLELEFDVTSQFSLDCRSFVFKRTIHIDFTRATASSFHLSPLNLSDETKWTQVFSLLSSHFNSPYCSSDARWIQLIKLKYKQIKYFYMQHFHTNILILFVCLCFKWRVFRIFQSIYCHLTCIHVTEKATIIMSIKVKTG